MKNAHEIRINEINRCLKLINSAKVGNATFEIYGLRRAGQVLGIRKKEIREDWIRCKTESAAVR